MKIHPVNLRNADLNLLTVFDAVMSEGSMTRAAEKLGMSQPAISNALSRFRRLVDDVLFVRTAQGMVPTVKARMLAEHIRPALDLVQAGLYRSKANERFDYSSSTRQITIVAEDYATVVLIPRFMTWLSKVAANMRVRLRSDPINAALTTKLNDGSVDMAIRYRSSSDRKLRFRHLLDDEFVSMVRQDHPTIGDTLTLSQYLALPHVVYGRLGRRGLQNSIVDREIKRLGATRRVALQVPGFQAMPVVIRNTDFICTLPRRIAQVYGADFHLKTLKTPLNLEKLSLYLVWSKSMDSDPAHEWFRDSFGELCQRV
ncbi:HTH-type transcriptional regulator LeuO OS=Afipia felis OX=1035 GN=leuO PE=3 SV=1 [Afipia felis]